LLEEMANFPPLFFSIKLHGMMLPDLSIAVSTPTVVPFSAFAVTDKLLIAIGINLSGSPKISGYKPIDDEIEANLN
jgi:hypothetical protein